MNFNEPGDSGWMARLYATYVFPLRIFRAGQVFLVQNFQDVLCRIPAFPSAFVWTAPASQNPESPPPLGDLRELLQFGLRQLAISDDGVQMIANLADDVDGEE